jgi:hypothetical protein
VAAVVVWDLDLDLAAVEMAAVERAELKTVLHKMEQMD